MFINFSLFVLLICTSDSNVIKIPEGNVFINDNLILEPVEYVNQKSSLWLNDIKDFINLIDRETLLETILRFIDDPEVMRFVGFLLSPQFKEIIWEIEMMEEFQEAYAFLKKKGYDMQPVIDSVNEGLKLPSFKPHPSLRYDKGVSGFIAAIIGTLPLKDMEELLRKKIENSPEFAELYEVMTSEEFKYILKRIISNPKFSDFKIIFENYGVDFDFICEILKEVIGTHYNGVFCQSSITKLLLT